MAADSLDNVIGRGLAASRPTSPLAEGYLYYETDTGILMRYSGSAWESASTPGLVYEFSTTTTDSDPGAGKLRFDNATPASVTTVYIDDQPHSSDADMGTVWGNLTGSRVLIQQASDPAKYLLGEVTADADGVGYWQLTVTVDDSGTLIDDAALVSVIVLGGGSGGGSTLQWWDEPWVHVRTWYSPSGGTLTHQWGDGILSLYGGLLDQDGPYAVSGYGDDTVPCSSYYDITPANASNRYITCAGSTSHLTTLGHYARVVARFHQGGHQDLYVGFNQAAYSTSTALNKAIFQHSDGDTNWMCRSADGTTNEESDSGVAFSESDWHVFEVYVYNDGGTMTAKYWIDGSLVATHTTNAPLSTGTELHIDCGSWWTNADVSTNDVWFYISEIKHAIKGAAHDLGRAAL